MAIASPLTRLTQKAVPFQWSDECEASFRKLKALVTSAPILTLPVEGEGFLCIVMLQVLKGKAHEAKLDEEGILRIKGRVCVPRTGDLTTLIMEEAHSSRYSIHPGAMKMYRDLKQHYWWCSMKRDIVKFVSKCLNCQQVKYEHQKPGGISQRMPIPEWKRERIAIDFVVRLPRTLGKFDSVWVIVDRLTKSAHLIPVHTTYTSEKLAKTYIREILHLQGVPVSIISGKGTQFTSYFWNGHWEQFLPLAEFAYNNSYYSSIKMAPFKALYGRRCRSPIAWFDSFEVRPWGTVLLRDSHVIRWDSVMLDQNLSYEEEPIAILDCLIRKLRSKEIASVKVHWSDRSMEEATWETELDMRARYPQLFEAP
ncbi:uncharacterized protein LOC132045187, partial [Lycium ferocissimum]|uniref:uncharacterized protein LOC132045187 n=1 Tax=Lycium ferocissimum TaxID=112874 RepID=UPI0028161B48